jgi:hypothetical protein
MKFAYLALIPILDEKIPLQLLWVKFFAFMLTGAITIPINSNNNNNNNNNNMVLEIYPDTLFPYVINTLWLSVTNMKYTGLLCNNPSWIYLHYFVFQRNQEVMNLTSFFCCNYHNIRHIWFCGFGWSFALNEYLKIVQNLNILPVDITENKIQIENSAWKFSCAKNIQMSSICLITIVWN